MRCYAGIGSRKTPMPVLSIMTTIGKWLAEQGLILRSGGAAGADSAFEKGANDAKGPKEIWDPRSNQIVHQWARDAIAQECWECPYGRMRPFTQTLLARNAYQILGEDGQSPVELVICWSERPLEQGFQGGGTRYAVRLAQRHNIPIFNLYNPTDKGEVNEWELARLREWCQKHLREWWAIKLDDTVVSLHQNYRLAKNNLEAWQQGNYALEHDGKQIDYNSAELYLEHCPLSKLKGVVSSAENQ